MSEDETKKQDRDGVFEKEIGSGVWWINYRDSSGRRRREKVGGKKAALKLVEKRRTEAREGVKMPENLRARRVTFREIADRALDHSKANKLSHGHDKWRMPALIDAFGTSAAEEITPGEIQQWLDSKADVWSPATRNRYLALLKLTYRLAEQDGKIKVNPARLVRSAKEKKERVRYLSDSEETALRTVIAKSYSEHLPELEIALMTGMRQGEQFGLTWDRVDLDNATLRLNKTKNGKPRFVRLNSRALVVMRALREFSLGGTVSQPHGKRNSARALGRVFLLNLEPYWFAEAVAAAGIADFHWPRTLARSMQCKQLRKSVNLVPPAVPPAKNRALSRWH